MRVKLYTPKIERVDFMTTQTQAQASPVVHPNPLTALRPKASQPERPRIDMRGPIVRLTSLSPAAHSILHKVIFDRSVRGSFNQEVAYAEKLLDGSRTIAPDNHLGTRVKIFRVGNMHAIEEFAATLRESNPSERNDVRSKLLWAVDQSYRLKGGEVFVCLHCGKRALCRRRGAKFCCNAHKVAYCRAKKSKT